MNNQAKEQISALVIDDEKLARRELISMLAYYPNIRIVGEADSVDKAIEQIDKHNPDLIFLNIQMPGKSGFDLLDMLEINAKIIFVTAFDDYAIRAFEVNALDYLPKPVSQERLTKSIERITEDITESTVSDKKLNYTDRLFIEYGNKTRFIKVNDITCIAADGDYSKLFLADGSYGLVSKTMKEWETRLPDNNFCRIHRSSIINIDYIQQIDKYFNNSYKISLKGIAEPLVISRRYAKKIKDIFG